jgi:hypothetical protein
MRWEGHVACMGGRTGSHRILVGNFEDEKPFDRPRRRKKDRFKIDL